MTERLTSKNGVQPLSEGRTTRKRKQMSETILTAENLKFRYDSEQPGYALNGGSMQVGRGEFVAVLGANGCGKTTIGKLIAGLYRPSGGRIMLFGKPQNPKQLQKQVLFILQEAEFQFFTNSVLHELQ